MNLLPNDEVTPTQVAVTIVSFTLNSTILSFPHLVGREVKTPDVWISILLAGLIVLLSSILLLRLNQAFPKKTIFEFSPLLVGRLLGYVLGIGFVVYFLLIASFEIRMMGEVSRIYLLEFTPMEVIMVTFLFPGAYLVSGGMSNVLRFYQLFFPITLILFIFIILGGMQNMRLDHLRPVLSEGVMPILQGVPICSMIFPGIGMILILIPFLNKPKKALPAVLVGNTIPTILYTLTILVVVGTLTTSSIETLIYPTMSTIRSIELPLAFFERIETFVNVLWILEVYMTFAGAYFFAAFGLSQLFRIQNPIYIYLLLPLIYFCSMVPQNIVEVLHFGEWIGYLGFIITVIIPIFFISLVWIRKIRHG